MNLYSILLFCALFTTANATLLFDSLEHEMTKRERKMTGIEKLTTSERAVIEEWLKSNQKLYHFTAPTVCDVRNIRWMYESVPLKRPSKTKLFDESVMSYTVSMVSILENSADELKAWLEHHKQQGVQHFYLYNHLSCDDYIEVLNPYLEMGEVELIQWPVRERADEDAICRHARALAQGRSKWLFFLEFGQYLSLNKKGGLPSILEEHSYESEVSVNDHLIVKPHLSG